MFIGNIINLLIVPRGIEINLFGMVDVETGDF